MSQVLSAELSERVQGLSDAVLVLVLDAFREGRRAGDAKARAELLAYVESRLAELEAQFRTLDAAGCLRLEDGYEDAYPSPVAAAHFGGAGDVLALLRARLRGQLERSKA